MNRDAINWESLERLRAAFLAGTAGATDYWQNETDLASYDATFAQRIGWKWDYVLAELLRRGWTPPCGDLFDWGCGSGIAHRAFLDFFGTSSVTSLRLFDRSTQAVQFAARRVREKCPDLRVEAGASESPAVFLISHVLTELKPAQIEELINLAAGAETILWVEPGTYEASYSLIAIREKLRGQFNVIAPCTHQARCGLLVPENESNWCHHFASPPTGIFHDPDWSQFANMTGIDLRDLPLSFLVLDKRSVAPLPAGATRVLGRPRIYKPHALLLGCDEFGVCERKLTKRALPAEFKRLKKGCEPLQVWQCAGDEITSTAKLT